METKAKIGLGVGGAVIALGAATGVGALAANLATGSNDATVPVGYGQADDGSARGNGQGRGGFDTATLAKTLAAKLGVDETTMAAALTEVMAANQPSGGQPSDAPSGQPTGQPSAGTGVGRDRTGMLQTLAKALATKLNLDEAKVLAALTEAMAGNGGPGGAASGQPSGQPTQK